MKGTVALKIHCTRSTVYVVAIASYCISFYNCYAKFQAMQLLTILELIYTFS